MEVTKMNNELAKISKAIINAQKKNLETIDIKNKFLNYLISNRNVILDKVEFEDELIQKTFDDCVYKEKLRFDFNKLFKYLKKFSRS